MVARAVRACDVAQMTSKGPISRAMLAAAGLLVFAACGDDTQTTPGGAANGEPCAEGSDCESTLCFIAVSDEPGECRAVPASCRGDPSCTRSDCLDEVESECTGNLASCVGIASRYTIECGPPIGGAGGAPPASGGGGAGSI